MSRISQSYIAMLFAIGTIVPMQLLDSRRGLTETLGNGSALGLAAVAISDSAGPGAGAGAVNGIAIGVQATASNPNLPCSGQPTTNCGNDMIAIGALAQATKDSSLAVGFKSRANGIGSSAFGVSSSAGGNASSAYGSDSNAQGDNSAAFGFNAKSVGAAASPWAPVPPPTDLSRLPSASSHPRRTQQLRWVITRERAASMPLP